MTMNWETLRKQADASIQVGRLAEAETAWLTALEETKNMPADDPRVALTLDNLADVTNRQGKVVIAELFFKQAVHLRTSAVGPDHLAVAASLNNLSKFYYIQGRFNLAEPLTQRFVEIYEKNLGENHPDVATGLHNMATIYHMQGKYREAEPIYRRALKIRQKALGVDHPDTVKLMKNLTTLTQITRRTAEMVGEISGSWKVINMPEEDMLRPKSD